MTVKQTTVKGSVKSIAITYRCGRETKSVWVPWKKVHMSFGYEEFETTVACECGREHKVELN